MSWSSGDGSEQGILGEVSEFAVVSLLLVFMLENGQRVEVSYFGAHWHQPLGVTLLLAAVLGFLLAVIAGFRRLVRGRSAARRNRRT
jgi:uncharacterized integral membrane protein